MEKGFNLKIHKNNKFSQSIEIKNGAALVLFFNTVAIFRVKEKKKNNFYEFSAIQIELLYSEKDLTCCNLELKMRNGKQNVNITVFSILKSTNQHFNHFIFKKKSEFLTYQKLIFVMTVIVYIRYSCRIVVVNTPAINFTRNRSNGASFECVNLNKYFKV